MPTSPYMPALQGRKARPAFIYACPGPASTQAGAHARAVVYACACMLMCPNMPTLQGNDAVGRPLLERALVIQEKALGPDHPDVIAIKDVLNSD